jgi:hypothetical protein
MILSCHARAGMHSKRTTVTARSRRWRTSCSGQGVLPVFDNRVLLLFLSFVLQPRSSRHFRCSFNNDLVTKGEFYPTLNKSQLFPEYIAEKSGHSRGSTLDLTLVNCNSYSVPCPCNVFPAGAAPRAPAGCIRTGTGAAAML